MIYKCKMCGGELDIAGKEHICECPFCGVTQTIPNVDEEKTLQLYNRATFLLKSCEYDKASSIYEKIIADQGEQAEAYWGLCLCKYGIEYVNDPKTGKKIPTCHRTLTNSILKDSDYLKALELADVIAKKLYKEEAEYIDTVQKKILEISKSEEPYDIFICYKESDKAGKRTPDSVLAEEIYDAFTEKAYRVFFSKISLEDKIGQEYEPFIFAALTSAKVMLAIGTKEEYFNAPWVKNEWSRFLKLCNKGEKKYLIPCYKDISPYEMPEEFVNLQAQDLGKLGYLQDLTKGIDKLFDKTALKSKKQLNNQKDDDIYSLYKELRKMLFFINDSSRFDDKAFVDKWATLYTLEDPAATYDNAKKAPLAYACNFLYTNKLPNFQYLNSNKAFEAMWNIEDIDLNKLEKTEPELAEEIRTFLKDYSEHREYLEKLEQYDKAVALKKTAKTPEDYLNLYQAFSALGDFRDAKRQAEFYKNKADSIFDASLNEYLYNNLVNRISKYNTDSEKEEILNGFKEISEYKDSSKYIAAYETKDPALIEVKINELLREKQNLVDSNSEIKQLNELINALKTELKQEIEKINKFLNDRKSLLEREVADIRKEYSETSQKLSKCGLFAIKEKKLLKDKLTILETELIKIKRENGRQTQDLETESNQKIENLEETYSQKIRNLEKEIQNVLDSNDRLKTICKSISSLENELEEARINQNDAESIRELWSPKNVFIAHDYYGFEILVLKLGKYPQSKVTTPSLLNSLRQIKPDNKGLYHLHGLEFFKRDSVFYLVEPIQWKFVKHTYRNGKYFYLLATRAVLDIKGPMLPENVVEVEHNDRPWEYFTKDEHEIVSLYKYSDIRKWLINDFFSFAFNENESKVICTASVDCSADSTSDETTVFYTENLKDKIFLLSYRAAKKTHLGDNFHFDTICRTPSSSMQPIINEENSIVENELLPSLGIDQSELEICDYNAPTNGLYEDSSELCWSDIYSDYSFSLTKVRSYNKEGLKIYHEGVLLRSPDPEDITGYNTCINGKVVDYGGQYEDGNFNVINDIVPSVIVCFKGNDEIIKPDDEFDF